MTIHPATAFFVFALLISPASLRAQDETPVEPVSPVTSAASADTSPVTSAAPANDSPVTPVAEPAAKSKARAKENVELRTEMAKLKGEMRKTAAENERTQSELNAAIEALKRENEDLKRAAINRANERNVLVQKLAAAQLAAQEKSKLADDASDASGELASARSTIDSLKAELEKLGGELVAEKERAEKAAALARESAGETGEKLAAAQKETSALRVDLAAARQGSIALGEQIQALTGENRRLSEQLSDESSKASKATDDATQNLAAARQATADAHTEISTLKARLAEVSGQNETIAREHNDTLAGSDALKTQLKTAEAALAETEKARDELAQRVATLEKQNTDEAEASAAAAEDLRRQVSEGEMKLGVALRSYQIKKEENDTLQKQFNEAAGENAQLSERVKGIEAKLADAGKRASANEQAAAQMIVLRENFRQLQIQSADAAEENARLKTRLALLAQAPAPSPAPPTMAGAPSRPARQATATEQPAQPAEPAAVVAATAASDTAAGSNVRMHTVGLGETLWSIAKKYNGGSQQVTAIYEANRDQLKSPDSLKPGMKLVIP